MGDISPNFNRAEFACGCGCGFDTVDAELLSILEKIREHFDRRIYINSGCRCEKHNRAVGGSKHSQHLIGRAADIVVEATPQRFVAELCEQLGVGGLGSYPTFTHIDSRKGIARWS